MSAREFATRALSLWRIESPEAIAVIGELAANAIQHGGPFDVVLVRERHGLRIDLTDRSSFRPLKRPSSGEWYEDRGLQIIDSTG